MTKDSFTTEPRNEENIWKKQKVEKRKIKKVQTSWTKGRLDGRTDGQKN